MGYGAPVTAPMVIDPVPDSSRFRPPLAEMPEMADAAVETLRRRGTLSKALPPMPGSALQDLYFTNTKQIEAAEYTNAVRNAFGISRQYDKRSRALAKARNYQAQKVADRAARRAYQDRRKRQTQTNQMEKRYVKHFARQIGVGPDLYK